MIRKFDIIIDVTGAIDINKTSTSKKCICHFWYFLDKKFRLQSSLCNDCHDVLMMFININSIAIFNIYRVDYYCIIVEIRNSEAINLLKMLFWLKIVDHYIKFIFFAFSIRNEYRNYNLW